MRNILLIILLSLSVLCNAQKKPLLSKKGKVLLAVNLGGMAALELGKHIIKNEKRNVYNHVVLSTTAAVTVTIVIKERKNKRLKRR